MEGGRHFGDRGAAEVRGYCLLERCMRPAAVLTAGFALLLVAGLVASGGAVDTIAFAGGLLLVISGAVAVLFSPGANAWYAARR